MVLVSSCFTEHIIILSGSVPLENNLKTPNQQNNRQKTYKIKQPCKQILCHLLVSK